MALALLAGCGAPPPAPRRAPARAPRSAIEPEAVAEPATPTAERPELEELLRACPWWDADEARRQPAVLCPEEDRPAPRETYSLPAIAADERSVAVLDRSYDCCSDESTVTAEVRNAQDGVLLRWALVDRDEDGEDRISAEVAAARVEELNEHLYLGRFRPMALAFESEDGMESTVSLDTGLTARLDGPDFEAITDTGVVARFTPPSYERDSDCCDGGLGRGRRCAIPSVPVAIWKHGRLLVISAAVVHQRDGCDSSPTLHVLELPAR